MYSTDHSILTHLSFLDRSGSIPSWVLSRTRLYLLDEACVFYLPKPNPNHFLISSTQDKQPAFESNVIFYSLSILTSALDLNTARVCVCKPRSIGWDSSIQLSSPTTFPYSLVINPHLSIGFFIILSSAPHPDQSEFQPLNQSSWGRHSHIDRMDMLDFKICGGNPHLVGPLQPGENPYIYYQRLLVSDHLSHPKILIMVVRFMDWHQSLSNTSVA